MAKSLFPRRDPRWPDQHIYERHFVPDEVGVYVCEQHRPVGLEVPEAFWNDVVGRGRFGRGALRIRQRPRPEPRWFPLYRLSPTAPLFSMADGQSYERGTDCSFTKTKSLADVENVSVIRR